MITFLLQQELQKKSENAMLKYTRTREPPSAESAARVKGGIREEAGQAAYHPYLRQKRDLQSSDILNRIANFKTNAVGWRMVVFLVLV